MHHSTSSSVLYRLGSLHKFDDDESSLEVLVQARRLLKKKHHKKKKAQKKKTHRPSLDSAVQPASLNWRTPFDGMISPVIVVGGNGGTASEKWFDRCSKMIFVTKIEGMYGICIWVDAW